MSTFEQRIAGLSPEKRALLLKQLGGERVPARPRIGRQPRDPEKIPLSAAQRRLWLIDQITPGSSTYNVAQVMRLSGLLDAGALARALDEIVARHEALRTTFARTAEGPVQRIAERLSLELTVEDLSGRPDAAAELDRRLRQWAALPFDLERGPLVLARLFRIAAEEHALFLNFHHIVVDGWSLAIFFRELAERYGAWSRSGAAGGAPPALPEPPIQYADFAIWQSGRPAEELEAEQANLAFFKERLEGARLVLELPTELPRPRELSTAGALLARPLPESLWKRIEALALADGTTPFAVLLAAFAAYLFRVTGQRDVLVGSPFAGRGRAEIDVLVGFFVNTLPLRFDLAAELSFREVVRLASRQVLDADAHQSLPFERLVEELAPPRDLSRAPIFQVMFSHETDAALDMPGLGARVDPVDSSSSKVDLSLVVLRGLEHWALQAEYATDLFTAAGIGRLLGHLETLLTAAVAEPDRPLARLPLLTDGELAGLAADRRRPSLAYQPEADAFELFAAQAEAEPGRPALLWGKESLTYGELLARAASLALELGRLGVGPEVRVGVCARRTPDLVIALLAVLGAGGAYVPLDPNYPADRLAFMLEDGRCTLLLTEKALLAGAGRALSEALPAATRVLWLDEDGSALPAAPTAPAASPRGLLARLRPSGPLPGSRLSHLIYTSGSTGRPKAVAIPVSAVAAFIAWARTLFTPAELAGVAASTSVCFDLSVFELFATLAAGGTVVLLDDALALSSAPARDRVTLINTVPSAMAELVRTGGLPASVATVNLAGEPLKNALVQDIYRTTAAERVYDLYGPSEDTTYSTFSRVERGATAEPSIGRAISGSWVTVLDRRGEALPQGVPGELTIGGEGLARGYLGRPALSAEKFVPDPFATEPGARLYRTGDLARVGTDGNLVFLGRIDNQVKIRGFRIELGEIEAGLLAHAGVRAAAVAAVAASGGELRLVAYVVPEPGEAPSASDLRAHLRSRLPDYMVPAAFMTLAALPLTPNGKVDRRTLPAPDWARPDVEQPYVAPRSADEEALAGLWREVLGVERVGVADNFFFLGGHSLLATQLVSRIETAFGVELAARDVFRAPTVADLATLIVQQRAAVAGDADLDALLAQLEGLSEEQARAQLSGEPHSNEEGR